MTILEEAQQIINGVREQTHGPKERSFNVIADLWETYLENRKEPSSGIHAIDVAWMMVLLKMARSMHGQPSRDHFVDAAGYIAIAAELSRDE
jgi:hypothetical protein